MFDLNVCHSKVRKLYLKLAGKTFLDEAGSFSGLGTLDSHHISKGGVGSVLDVKNS